MIHLRLRSEFSFRNAFGSVEQVAKACAASGGTHAGLVDTSGTWGHVTWERAALAEGIEPLFGAEFRIKNAEGRNVAYWALAKSLPAFYRFSSDPPETQEEIAARKDGLIIFSGGALTLPEAIDYIDINPRSRLRTERALALAEATGKPLVITGDNDYPTKEDREAFLAWDDSQRMTPQHILSLDELRESMDYVPHKIFDSAFTNTLCAAQEASGCRMRRAPMIEVKGDLCDLVAAGKAQRLARGHIKKWSSVYESRLERELKLIKEKHFESYFLVVADMIAWAKDHMLVGPGRGSSAGSLVCYLLRITEIDPIVHDLIFERFIDASRNDLPDIDTDFNDQKRDDVFAYLAEKYGTDHTARIGSVNRLKPRSVFAHGSKKLGIPHGAHFPVIDVLPEYASGDARFGKSLEDAFEMTKQGRDFIGRYPEASIITKLENVASHSGVHAAGFVVALEPVTEYCTVRDGVAQIDKKDAETLNLLKMDVLGLRTLGVIEDAACTTADELYGLTLDDKDVFSIFNEAKLSGVFQFEGATLRRVTAQVPIKAFRQIDHITALARPGPLGAGAVETYIKRNAGREPLSFRHPKLAPYLSDTMGVILYQEQVMTIVKELGEFSWEDTAAIRKAMGGRKGKEYFDKHGEKFINGAAKNGIDAESARLIWLDMVNFGGYGLNRAHTVSYAIISYWCAWLKRYHGIDYAAACLRNAKDDEQAMETLRELRDEGISYVPFDVDRSAVDWSVQNGIIVGGFRNLVGVGPIKATYYANHRPLSDKDRAALQKHAPKFQDLALAHSRYGAMYRNPENYNIIGGVKQFSELDKWEDAVIICQMTGLQRRDENEAARVARRNGKQWAGNPTFLDVYAVDDSISKPATLRIKSDMWESIGQKIAERAEAKKDWFLVRGKWLPDFTMLLVSKIKCLTNSDMFS